MHIQVSLIHAVPEGGQPLTAFMKIGACIFSSASVCDSGVQ